MRALPVLVGFFFFSPVSTIQTLHGMTSFFPYISRPVIDIDIPIPLRLRSPTVSRLTVGSSLLGRPGKIPRTSWTGPGSIVRRVFAGPNAMSRTSMTGQGSIPRYLLEGLDPILRPTMGSEPWPGIGSHLSRGSRSLSRGPRQILHQLRKAGVIGDGTRNRGYYIPNSRDQRSSSYDSGYDVFIMQRKQPARGPRGVTGASRQRLRSSRQPEVGQMLPPDIRFSVPPDAGMSPRTRTQSVERLPPGPNNFGRMPSPSPVQEVFPRDAARSPIPDIGPLSPRTGSPPMERLAPLPRNAVQSLQYDYFPSGSSSPNQGSTYTPGGPQKVSTHASPGGLQPENPYQPVSNPGQRNSYIPPDWPRQRNAYVSGLNRGGAYAPAGGPDPGRGYQSAPGPEQGPGNVQGPYQPSSGAQLSGPPPAGGSGQDTVLRNTNRAGSDQLLQGQGVGGPYKTVRSDPNNLHQQAADPYLPITPYSPNAAPPGAFGNHNVGPPYNPMSGLSPQHGGPNSRPSPSTRQRPLPPSGGRNAGPSPQQSIPSSSIEPLLRYGSPNNGPSSPNVQGPLPVFGGPYRGLSPHQSRQGSSIEPLPPYGGPPAGGPDPGRGSGPELGPGHVQGPYQPSSGAQPSGPPPAGVSRQDIVFRNINRSGSYQLLQGKDVGGSYKIVRSDPNSLHQQAADPYLPITPYSLNAAPPGAFGNRNVGPPYNPMSGLSPQHGGPKSRPSPSTRQRPLPPSGGRNAGPSPQQSIPSSSIEPLPPYGGPNNGPSSPNVQGPLPAFGGSNRGLSPHQSRQDSSIEPLPPYIGPPAGGPDPGRSSGPEQGPGHVQGPYQPSSGAQQSGPPPAGGSGQDTVFRNTNRAGSDQLLQEQGVGGSYKIVRSDPNSLHQQTVDPYLPIMPYSPNAAPPGAFGNRSVGPQYNPMAGLSPQHGGPNSRPSPSTKQRPLPPSGGRSAGPSPQQSIPGSSIVPLPPYGGPNSGPSSPTIQVILLSSGGPSAGPSPHQSSPGSSRERLPPHRGHNSDLSTTIQGQLPSFGGPNSGSSPHPGSSLELLPLYSGHNRGPPPFPSAEGLHRSDLHRSPKRPVLHTAGGPPAVDSPAESPVATDTYQSHIGPKGPPDSGIRGSHPKNSMPARAINYHQPVGGSDRIRSSASSGMGGTSGEIVDRNLYLPGTAIPNYIHSENLAAVHYHGSGGPSGQGYEPLNLANAGPGSSPDRNAGANITVHAGDPTAASGSGNGLPSTAQGASSGSIMADTLPASLGAAAESGAILSDLFGVRISDIAGKRNFRYQTRGLSVKQPVLTAIV